MKNASCTLPRARPATDLIECDNAFYLYLDIPGVSKKALRVEVEGGELLVSASASTGACRGEYLHVLEFGDMDYRTSFALPRDTDTSNISAKMEFGVLEITIPKRQPAAPLGRIKINVV